MRPRKQNRMSGCVSQRIHSHCHLSSRLKNKKICAANGTIHCSKHYQAKHWRAKTNRPQLPPEANDWDQIFNSTSYLCSTGCKLILCFCSQQEAHPVWVRSLASGAAAGRTEEGHNQNETQQSETREPWPCSFKVEIDTQLSAEKK